MDDATSKRIGLALSGGGVRAAAFHAGVLMYLAERGRLEDVAHISSVSGGTLFTGLVFTSSGYRWPSSAEYRGAVHEQVRKTLTGASLQARALGSLLLKPSNWRFAFARANVMARTIRSLWGIEATLGDLPAVPVWSINATTGETGRRFRFSGRRMGDYEIGYADASSIPLCSAMAMSAAFPVGVGPLVIRTGDYGWFKREEWDGTEERPRILPFGRLHLYDGGLYDNLGLEPFFDVGRREIKARDEGGVDCVIVSDAGTALERQMPHWLSPSRFKRIADLALDQTRALRVRCFVNFLQDNPARGAYVQIGARLEDVLRKPRGVNEERARHLNACDWLDARSVERAANYPTTLARMDEGDFHVLSRHGYETARWNGELFK